MSALEKKEVPRTSTPRHRHRISSRSFLRPFDRGKSRRPGQATSVVLDAGVHDAAAVGGTRATIEQADLGAPITSDLAAVAYADFASVAEMARLDGALRAARAVRHGGQADRQRHRLLPAAVLAFVLSRC